MEKKRKSIKAMKEKGNQFEYDVQYNLEKMYSSVTRTSERGYQRQIDLIVEGENNSPSLCIECKRHQSFTWNQLKKTFDKLVDATRRYDPQAEPLLIFQANRQPVLVMEFDNQGYGFPVVSEFEISMGVPFEKRHKIKKQKKKRIISVG